MASFINNLLKSELTIIPSLLNELFGSYYNNTLCNGATWIFILWCVSHAFFDHFINIFLKKLKYKEYVRIRLKQSLWYLGFYTTALIYCLANLQQYNDDLFTIKLIINGNDSLCKQMNLGFLLFALFYLHCSLWELLNSFNILATIKYINLFIFTLFVYFLSFVDLFLQLTTLICIGQVFQQLIRCLFVFVKNHKSVNNFGWISSIITIILSYVVIIPYYLGRLLCLKLNFITVILDLILMLWLMMEMYDSIVTKSIIHYLKHSPDDKTSFCYGNIIECSLFPPRNDLSYRLELLRNEIKEREAQTIANRKPKNRNVVYQTLKCMVALKRKLEERRNSSNNIESDDSNNQQTEEIVEENLQDNENKTKID